MTVGTEMHEGHVCRFRLTMVARRPGPVMQLERRARSAENHRYQPRSEEAGPNAQG